MGLFVGVFFLIPGVQIIGAALFCVPVRGNIPIAAGMTFLTNPFTTPFLILASLPIGNLFGFHADGGAIMHMYKTSAPLGEWLSWLASDAAPALVIGLFIVAVASALIGWLISIFVWRWWVARKWRRRGHAAQRPIDRPGRTAIGPSHTPDTGPAAHAQALHPRRFHRRHPRLLHRSGRQPAWRRTRRPPRPPRSRPQYGSLRLRRRRHGPKRRPGREFLQLRQRQLGPDHGNPRRPLQLRHVHPARRSVADAHPRDRRAGGAHAGLADRRFLRELHGRGGGQRRRHHAAPADDGADPGDRRTAPIGRPRRAGCSARA